MADRFVLCPSCSRHAKAHEARCPFCGEGLDAARPSKGDPYRRMAAAAAVAAGVAALPGCGGPRSGAFYGSPGIVEPRDDSGGAGDDGAADAPAPAVFYGIANPMPDDAGGDAGDGAPPGDGPEPADGSGDSLG